MNRLRLSLAIAGFTLALMGVALDDSQLGWGAIALLAASLILRIVLRKGENPRSGSDTRL